MRKFKNIRYWLPVIIWAALIFIVSSITFQVETETGLPLDKVAHFFEYFILSFLLIRALRKTSSNSNPLRLACISFIISWAYGISDEYHQLLVPGREFELLDIMSDGLGALGGTSIYTIRLIMVKKG